MLNAIAVYNAEDDVIYMKLVNASMAINKKYGAVDESLKSGRLSSFSSLRLLSYIAEAFALPNPSYDAPPWNHDCLRRIVSDESLWEYYAAQNQSHLWVVEGVKSFLTICDEHSIDVSFKL